VNYRVIRLGARLIGAGSTPGAYRRRITFRLGYIPRSVNEFGKAGVTDFVDFEEIVPQAQSALRPFVGAPMVVDAATERPAWNKHHVAAAGVGGDRRGRFRIW
jgi:hypothetical protein